ncbi:hypothetical protein IAR50_006165 [Cryptococcus sp. DSM 104548]
MRSAFALLVFGAIAVSSIAAQITPRHMALFPRQIESSTIPPACSSQCSTAMSIYASCTSSPVDTAGCLKVCEQSTFNYFVKCMDCTVEQGGVTGSYVAQLMDAVDQLKEACAQVGQPVTGGVAGATSYRSGSRATQTVGPGTYSGTYVSRTQSASAAASGSAIASGLTDVASDGAAAATSSQPAAVTEKASSSAGPVSRTGRGLLAGIFGMGAGAGFLCVI